MTCSFWRRAEDKGLFRTGVKSFAFIPLSTVDPKGTPGLVERLANKIDVAKKNGTLPPGLAEQFDIQLETLKNDRIPDVEFLAFPPPKRKYDGWTDLVDALKLDTIHRVLRAWQYTPKRKLYPSASVLTWIHC